MTIKLQSRKVGPKCFEDVVVEGCSFVVDVVVDTTRETKDGEDNTRLGGGVIVNS
jgi:hypothetical protein